MQYLIGMASVIGLIGAIVYFLITFSNRKNSEVQTEESYMYTKVSIFFFAFLFSPFFASFLYGQNLNEIGKKKLVVPVIIGFMIFSFIILVITKSFVSNEIGKYFLTNIIGALVMVGPLWAHQIGQDEITNKRKIWGPLFMMIGLISVFVFIIIFMSDN